MKRKRFLIFIMLLFIVGEIGLYKYIEHNKIYNSLNIEFNDVDSVEYGSEFDVKSLIKTSYGEIVYPTLNTLEVGVHDLVFKVSDKYVSKEYIHSIEVTDKKVPVIKLKKDKIEVEYGKSIVIDDYIESVIDEVDGRLALKGKDEVGYYYKDHVDYKKAGTYKVKITAQDCSGNKSEKTITVIVKEEKKEEIKPEQTLSDKKEDNEKKVIVINAGHQGKGNNEKEPIGPNASQYKAKVSYGATGTYTKIAERETVLDVSKKLKKELEKKGYVVYMTRTSQNVDISNSERAKFANNKKADAVISIHCDSNDNHSVKGAHTISIAKDNKYCSYLYDECSLLAKNIINEYCKVTGIKNRGVSYRNDLTTLNWSQVPSVMLEMGFISNKEEDKLLNDSDFQKKIVKGIVNGIDLYFSNSVE